MDTLQNRLNAALEQAKMNKKDLADKAQVSKGAVSHWCNGRSKTIKTEQAQKVAEALGISYDWLTTGKGPMVNSNVIAISTNDIPSSEFVQISEYHVEFGAGACPEPTYDEISDTLPATYRKDYFTNKGIDPSNCKRFRVKGDSMQPLINDGDRILVDCSQRYNIDDNAVYAIFYDHTLRVKRLRKTLKSLIIHSDNPSYSDEELTLEEANQLIVILGKVIERSGSV